VRTEFIVIDRYTAVTRIIDGNDPESDSGRGSTGIGIPDAEQLQRGRDAGRPVDDRAGKRGK